MKWVISLILLLLIVVGLTMLVTSEPGFVLIKYGDWSMETTLGVFLTGTLLAVVVLYLLLRLSLFVGRAPARIRAWRARRNRITGERALIQGLLAFYQGNWDEAEGKLIRNAPRSPSPVINHLASAHAAAAHGDLEQRDAYLNEARLHYPGDAMTIGLTHAQLLLQQGDAGKALLMLEQLHQHAPRNPQVLRLMARAYLANGDWTMLLALIPDLSRRNVHHKQDFEQLQLDAWKGMLSHTAAHGDTSQLHAQWNRLPRQLRKDQAIIALYAKLVIAHKLQLPTAPLLADSIRYQWNTDLVRLYALADGSPLSSQIEQAEGWLEEHPDNGELLLCLGRLCSRSELWGKARDYLKAAAVRNQPHATAELARVYDLTNDREQALSWYRKAIAEK